MEFCPLGASAIEVSRIGLGTWPLGGSVVLAGRPTGYGTVPESEAVRTIRRAVELGIRFFDTADTYGLGRAEKLLGAALADRRGEAFVATKAGWIPDGSDQWTPDLSPEHLVAAAERSRRRLGVDTIDLFQLHRVPEAGPETERALDALEELKTRGVIRLAGASAGHDVAGGRRLLKTGRLDALQVHYNLLHQAAAPLLDEARAAGVGVIASTPLAYGFLAGRYARATRFSPDDWRSRLTGEEIAARVERVHDLRFLARNGERTLLQAAIRFVLSHPAVTVAIPGCRRVEQVDEIAGTFASPPLSDIEIARARDTLRTKGRVPAGS
jgi:aryl-alcohol dehydrogenase-like predicted oxidoreductase